MPTNPYNAPTLTNYNASAPSNDGTEVASNLVDWDHPKEKLGDPLKTFAQAISDAASTAFDSTVNTGDNENNSMTGSLAYSSSELTIATGSITPRRTHHRVDTEADAATDDLDTITTGSVSDGCLLIIRAQNTARTVVVKNGTGNILLDNNEDFSIDDDEKSIMLLRVGANWNEVSRSERGLGTRFESAETTLTTSSTATLAHGLPAAPNPETIGLHLVCQTAEQNYSIGDKIAVNPNLNGDATTDNGWTVSFDATNILIHFGAALALVIVNKTAFNFVALTPANWKVVVGATV